MPADTHLRTNIKGASSGHKDLSPGRNDGDLTYLALKRNNGRKQSEDCVSQRKMNGDQIENSINKHEKSSLEQELVCEEDKPLNSSCNQEQFKDDDKELDTSCIIQEQLNDEK